MTDLPGDVTLLLVRWSEGEDAAKVLGVSRSTLEREWSVARAWLRRELGD